MAEQKTISHQNIKTGYALSLFVFPMIVCTKRSAVGFRRKKDINN